MDEAISDLVARGTQPNRPNAQPKPPGPPNLADVVADVRLLSLLERNGIRTTADLVARVQAGTIHEIDGIGPITEGRLVKMLREEGLI